MINYFLPFSHCSARGRRTWFTAHGLNDEETALGTDFNTSRHFSKSPFVQYIKALLILTYFQTKVLRLKKRNITNFEYPTSDVSKLEWSQYSKFYCISSAQCRAPINTGSGDSLLLQTRLQNPRLGTEKMKDTSYICIWLD